MKCEKREDGPCEFEDGGLACKWCGVYDLRPDVDRRLDELLARHLDDPASTGEATDADVRSVLEAARRRQDTPLSPEQRRAIGIDETPAADWMSSDEDDDVEERAKPLYVGSLRDGGVIVTASSYATGVLQAVEVVLTEDQVEELTTRLLDHRDATRRRRALLQEEADWQRKRAAEKQASRDADAAALASGAKTRAQFWRESAAVPGAMTTYEQKPLTIPGSGAFDHSSYGFRPDRLMVPQALYDELGQPKTTDELHERLTEKFIESDRLRQDALDALGGVVLMPKPAKGE